MKLSTIGALCLIAAPLIHANSDTNTTASSTNSTSSAEDDLQTLWDQKISYIVSTLTGKNSGSILKWLATEEQNGQFTDVNYATGCSAQRSNWPAQQHWIRLRPISAAYSDLIPHSSSLSQKAPKQFSNNATVKAGLDAAMGWWFSNDFTDLACLDRGGVGDSTNTNDTSVDGGNSTTTADAGNSTTTDGGNSTCPCGTPGMWNPNWFSNIISIPQLSGEACLLCNSSLSASQRAACIKIGDRAYVPVDQYVNGVGLLKGSNALDLAYVGISTGLLKYFNGGSDDEMAEDGSVQVFDAYKRAHDEMIVVQGTGRDDGVRADGSFSQHGGILYDGNYGKDYTLSLLSIELPAAGTQYEGGNDAKLAFGTHVDGWARWMVYANSQTGTLHWDFNTVGRMISYATIDNQATANLKLNLSMIQQLGEQWEASDVTDAMRCLLKNMTSDTGGEFAHANANEVVGNRMFWINDYMVHRGDNFVSSLKMVSTRTTNTECVNGQNTKGFYLGQGALFTYVSGFEYEDIAGAWDWNLIPGTTVAYNSTPLSCSTTSWNGSEAFVGGVSDGTVGAAAMKWTHPMNASILSYRKAWFFLEDGVQHVMVPETQVGVEVESPVWSVLDQRRANVNATGVWVDGEEVDLGGALGLEGNGTEGAFEQSYENATTVWYDGVGYALDTCATGRGAGSLSLSAGPRAGDWSEIGTSSAGNVTVPMFAAWIEHANSTNSTNGGGPVSYTMYPGTSSYTQFASRRAKREVVVLRNDVGASALVDVDKGVFMGVFWGAGNVTIPAGTVAVNTTAIAGGEEEGKKNGSCKAEVVVASDQAVVMLLDLDTWIGSVSDPTQELLNVTLSLGISGDAVGSVTVGLPQGSNAGRSIQVELGSGKLSDAGSELHLKKRKRKWRIKRKEH